MTCSPSKYTGDAASSRVSSSSSASGRAGSCGGGLLLLLLALALVASPDPSYARPSAAPRSKPFGPGKPLPASMCAKAPASREPWSGLEVYPDELWAFLLLVLVFAAIALFCLWVCGAFVPVARASSTPAATVPSPAAGPSPFGDRFAFMNDPAIRFLWSDADPGESWKSSLDRALRYCHGAASEDELLAILRLHPRALRDRDWPLAVRRLIDAQPGSSSEGDWSPRDRPVCRFFTDSILHPAHDRAPRGRFTSEEVSPTF